MVFFVLFSVEFTGFIVVQSSNNRWRPIILGFQFLEFISTETGFVPYRQFVGLLLHIYVICGTYPFVL